MRLAAAAAVALFLLPALGLLAGAASAEEEGEGGPLIEPPLWVAFVVPANGSAVSSPDLHAIVQAGGATATLVQDDFANGTLVNATSEGGLVAPNASAPGAESYYQSPALEFPPGATYRWSDPLDILLTGGGALSADLVSVSVRFGDRTPGRNWSQWISVGLGGDFGPVEAVNASLVGLPAFQYRVDFTDPTNDTNPSLAFVAAWYLSPVASVHARLGLTAAWTQVGAGEGEFPFNTTLAPGPNTLQARVVDTAGREVVLSADVSFDSVSPTVESAPAEGAVIPVDQAAEIAFSEPVDTASASAAITVTAPFTVDRVWSADGTRLFLSAAGAGEQGPVTVTIGPGLLDRAGNRFNDTRTYHYTMGPAAPAPELPLGLVALLIAGAAAAGVAVWHSGRVRKQRIEHARRVVRQEAEGGAPEGPADAPAARAEDRR